MSLTALRDAAAELLTVEAVVLSPESVQVGDTFSVRATVTNSAEAESHNPTVVFLNVRLQARPTSFAELDSDEEVPVAESLVPGESAEVTLQFRALDRFPSLLVTDLKEPYAELKACAHCSLALESRHLAFTQIAS